ncbi:hypothetical protein ACIBCR_15570 [Micromonospora echinospora]|uniref:hypothetical protein n=1 Tax=Micromonospora echinospora TaxID=1877 RepID=UPI0037A8D0DA
MLTDQQLTETALKLIAAELDQLAHYDLGERVYRLLDEHTRHGADDGSDVAAEVRAIHQKVKGAVAVLRIELARYAANRDITLPEPPTN